MTNQLSLDRISTSIVSNMEASWLISRPDGTIILTVQAQGHPEYLELLESLLNEGFIVQHA